MGEISKTVTPFYDTLFYLCPEFMHHSLPSRWTCNCNLVVCITAHLDVYEKVSDNCKSGKIVHFHTNCLNIEGFQSFQFRTVDIGVESLSPWIAG